MNLTADVCIAGGGPAGMMLGLLLARRGVKVVVLEKHADFLRDFRGDTVHPSTLTLLDQMGLGPEIAAVPHRDVDQMRVAFADGTYRLADFSKIGGAHPYIRFMPQWDFLDVLARAAEPLAQFTLLRSHEVTDVIESGGAIRGVRAHGPDGPVEVRARLTVGADGRHSVVRAQAGLRVRQFGAPMDVLWFRLPRRQGALDGLAMNVSVGKLILTIDRGDYWQTAFVIPKGHDARIRAAGLDAFRRSIAAVPDLAAEAATLTDWEQVSTLTVQLDRAVRWHRPGLLCIGDAAHAMSPIGGVGINLAIQDAVCTARLLADPLLKRRPAALSSRRLAAVQARRRLPTSGTQLIQRAAQHFLVRPVLTGSTAISAPLPIRLLARVPSLQAFPARLIGKGLLPERLG